MNDLPDFMPTLSAGAHDPHSGEACLMEYVSLLAGEPWTDRPECTHPILAHEARTVNDLLTDRERPRLVPLIGRLFGTSQDSAAIRAALRLTQARRVARLLDDAGRARVAPFLALTEAASTDPSTNLWVPDLIGRAMAFPVADGELDDAHRAVHVGASTVFAFVLAPDLEPTEAAALLALTVAHRIAAGECRANCGEDTARGRLMVDDLLALVDTYDDVTGRTPDEHGDAVRELAAIID